MAAPWHTWSKRRKFSHHQKDEEEYEVKYPEIVIFFVHARIQRGRLDQLKRLARKNGFAISSELSDAVTHVVSEINTRDHVISILQRISVNRRIADFDVLDFAKKAELLSLKWFTACIEEGKPVEVTDEHRLQERKPGDPTADDEEEGENKRRNRKFTCQRITPLNHPNKKFTDALEILERAADVNLADNSQSRALAFRKASAAIKALPEEITKPSDVDDLYDIKAGAHCHRVILDILEHGSSLEVERMLRSDWYKTMQLFTGVFGCGKSTAVRWSQMGLRTLEDVKSSYVLNLTRSQNKGIEYYSELNTSVTREEADWIHKEVAKELEAIRPGSSIVLTGGFIRGKDSGHDVDFLISHPVEGKEVGILTALLQALNKRNLLDYTDIQNAGHGQNQKGSEPNRKYTMDHYERCFSILRLPKSAASKPPTPPSQMEGDQELSEDSVAMVTGNPSSSASGKSNGAASADGNGAPVDTGRSWVARRVDFVIAPASQYAFALLGWTGSKMFNRSMRDYANKVMNMNLNSHGLFDKTNNCALTANSQEEIFELLKLEYRKPEERNC